MINHRIGAAVPVADVQRARDFYEGTLGLTAGNDGKLTGSRTDGYGFGNAGIVSTYTFTFSQ